MQPIVIGHRGASGYRPEHTRSAYELAFELGADAVEPDIVATRDGVLVLRHESEISQTTPGAARAEFAGKRTTKCVDGVDQTGWFTEDFTWAELSTLQARERLPHLRPANAYYDDRFPILRLHDLFGLIDEAQGRAERPLAMVAEIKNATYFESIGLPLAELFAAEVSAAGWNDDRLLVESFEPGVLESVRARGIRGKRVFLLAAEAPQYADYLTPSGLAALAGQVDGISVDKSLLLQTDAAEQGTEASVLVDQASVLVDEAHGAGLEAYCWTLRPENHFLAPSFRGACRSGGRSAAPGADFGRWEAEFSTIMSTGIDGVFADHPDLAVQVRERR